jgi:CHAT domain
MGSGGIRVCRYAAVMAAKGLPTVRLVRARRALLMAESAEQCLTPIAWLIDLAEFLRGNKAERAARLLDEALGYARAVVAELSPGREEYLLALFLQAYAALARDAHDGLVADLDDGIECLRRLLTALPADAPVRNETEAMLGAAILRRLSGPSARVADLDEAGTLLLGLFGRLPPDAPDRRKILSQLAIVRAMRFAGFGGTEADRETALGHAAACLALPAADDGPDSEGGTCHVVIAWLALARQFDVAHRSMLPRWSEFEASRSDGAAAARLMAEFGEVRISADDAQTALDHLRQGTAASADVQGIAGMLWAMAVYARISAGAEVSEADITRVADETRSAADAIPEEDPDRGEMLGLHAVLLTMRDMAGGAHAPGKDTTSAMNDVAARFPVGHPVRSAGIDAVRQGLGQQAAEAKNADDAAARLEDVVTALEQMPDGPETAQALVVVGMQVLNASYLHRSAMEQERLIDRLGAALERLDPDDPVRPVGECAYWMASAMQATLRGQIDRVDPAIGELLRCAKAAPAGHVARTLGYFYAAGILIERHGAGGEIRHLEQAEECVLRAFEDIDPDGPFADGTQGHGGLLYLRGRTALVRYAYDHDPDRVSAATADLERAAALRGPQDPADSSVASTLDLARNIKALRGMLADGTMRLDPAHRETIDNFLERAEQIGADHPEYPFLLMQAAGGLAMRGLADRDMASLDRAVRLTAAAVAIPTLLPRERPLLLERHGFALLTRYQLSRSPRDLSNAIDRLEEARRAVEQELASMHAGDVLQSLSLAYRTRDDASRGDVNRAVTHGLAGLREHLGDVFLQDSDSNALFAARRGTNDAVGMARWFLEHGKTDATISALELGRGMVLHAATTGAGVAAALRDVGQSALADEWAARARSADNDDLRYRVMLALERSPAEARLLSPPSAAGIAAALAAADADALVYLLPRDDDGPGIGVVIDRAGMVRRLPSPALHTGQGSPVAAFVSARRALDAAILHAPGDLDAAERDWDDALDQVCGWAWSAVIWPLLQDVPARGRPADRRIVLVPTGELGLVPWHAARHPGTRAWYACQEAIFSYAPSARQFADAVRSAPGPWARQPVLISDSTGLPYITATGIVGLYTAHYRGGIVYGEARRTLPADVPGAGAAGPRDVLAALARGADPGASVLHFGCHGSVRVPVLESSLDLGIGGELAVRDILRSSSAGPPGERPAEGGGLVVLAACLSDVTEADYDEALTLATTFLAGGASGVVAARWAVRESTTAIFMAMFHHYLNGSCPSPGAALRRAQLWMLDEARSIPDSMPQALREEAELPAARGGPRLTTPAAWAAFSYQGR